MRRKALISALVFSAVLAVVGYAVGVGEAKGKGDVAEKTGAEKTESVQNSDLTLLFFLNPYGQPCRMQDSVLKGMGEKLTGSAELKYIKTTDPDSRAQFSKYGIRALPSLILVDGEGNSVKRFPPGIQSENSILDAMEAGEKR